MSQLTNTLKLNTGLIRILIIGLLVALAFYPIATLYFTGEDFVFVHFVAAGKAFAEPVQNLFYRPVPNLLWQADYTLWGLNASGYHITNLIVHFANTILVGVITRQVGLKSPWSWLAMTLFLFQPIHVEPIAWVAGRPDLLATFFFLISLQTGIRYFEKGSLLLYIISLLSFGLGLFSKEIVLSMPIFLLGWILWTQRANFSKVNTLKLLVKFLPYLIVIIIYIAVRIVMLGSLGGYEGGLVWWDIPWNLTVGLWLPLLYPVNLASLGLGAGLIFVIVLSVIYGWLGWSVWRKRDQLVPQLSGLIFSVGLIYAGMLLALPNSPVRTDLEQSRFLYLPSIGFCLLLAILLRIGFDQVKWSTFGLTGLIAVTILSFWLALWPWLQASQITQATFPVLTSQNLPIKTNDIIYYDGLPDNWHGAYIWRNGLDDATRLFINPNVGGIFYTKGMALDTNRIQKNQTWFLHYTFDPNSPTSLLLDSVKRTPSP